MTNTTTLETPLTFDDALEAVADLLYYIGDMDPGPVSPESFVEGSTSKAVIRAAVARLDADAARHGRGSFAEVLGTEVVEDHVDDEEE